MSPLILLAEDERDLAHILADTLRMLRYRVVWAADGREALRHYRELRPDLVITDVMMPEMDGFALVRAIRATDRSTPILFLTARTDTDDVVSGLNMGGNDYLRKPFAMRELVARVEVLLNWQPAAPAVNASSSPDRSSPDRSSPTIATVPSSTTLSAARLTLHATTQELYFDEQLLGTLSARETRLLEALFRRAGEVVESQWLQHLLWSEATPDHARSLHVFISKLRSKLAPEPRVRILNVHGVGYRLAVEATHEKVEMLNERMEGDML